MGCSLAYSTAPASCNTFSRVFPSVHTTSINSIRPVVTVPVLSSITVSIRRVLCNTSTPLMMIPICAALPAPTMSAVGVAKPRAHGHAIINTATAELNAFATSSPSHSHAARVPIEIRITTGTNIALTRSAIRCTGAFVACASRTNLAILAN